MSSSCACIGGGSHSGVGVQLPHNLVQSGRQITVGSLVSCNYSSLNTSLSFESPLTSRTGRVKVRAGPFAKRKGLRSQKLPWQLG